jgi:transcriptional regulator with XRE-family HTH domain
MRETHGITHGSGARIARRPGRSRRWRWPGGDRYHLRRTCGRPERFVGGGCAVGDDPKGVVAVGPPVVTFAGLLGQLRTEAGLSQEELAAAGVGVRTISDLERGVALTARKDTARLLADALKLIGAARASFDALARGRAAPGASPPLVGGVAGGAERRLRPGRCRVISHRLRAVSQSCGSWLA